MIGSITRYLNAQSRQRAFKRDQRIDFYRAMYLYQRAGARKLVALGKLRDTYNTYLSTRQRVGNTLWALFGVKRKVFRPAIVAVAEAGLLRSNLPLAEALKDWLPPAERAILAAGESSGNLVGAFQMAGKFARQQGGMWAAIFAGFAYPILLIAGILAILYLIAEIMVPAMVTGHKAVYSPLTQVVLLLAGFIHDYWYLAAAIPAVCAIAIIGSLSRWRGPWRVRADRIAPWSFYRRIHGALFLYSFAVLQNSGVPIKAALANLASTANPYLRSRITAATYGVRQGYDIGKSLRNAGHEFPDWQALPVIESIGSQSGSADALIEYAENWLQDTTAYIERFTRKANALARTGIIAGAGVLAITVLEVVSSSYK